jgi:hypothetical protein
MTEQQFFDELLQKTKQQFEKAPIYKIQVKEGNQWHYSVCGTLIQRSKGLSFALTGVLLQTMS